MPRVSDEHLARRRQQILDAAQLCFARKGFHETSMQDIFAESDLSSGAVYRYFASKNELIAALAVQTTAGLRARMIAAIRADPLPTPAELVTELSEVMIAQSEPSGPLRLAPQVWALALVDPGAAEYVRAAMLTIRGYWHEYAERMCEAGWLPADADVPAVASAMMGVLPGFLLQHLIIGDISPETMARGVRTLFPYGERQ